MAKICILTSYAPSLIRFRFGLIQRLLEFNNDIYIIAPCYTESIKRRLLSLGINLIQIPNNRKSFSLMDDLSYVYKIYMLCKSSSFDIFFSYFAKPVAFGNLGAFFGRVPRRVIMIEGLGSLFSPSNSFSLKRYIIKNMLLFAYRLSMCLSHKIIFLNPDDYNDLCIFRSHRFKSSILGGIGVDLDEWCYREPVLNPVTFTFSGRFIPEKGLEIFLKAALIVRQYSNSIRFIVLGDADESPVDLTLLYQLVEAKIVEWPGFVDPHPWIEQTSVFVLPSSYREGVPLSIQEAMASGCPIITTSLPGCKETIIDGLTGYFVDYNCVESLALAMLRFVFNPDLICSMGISSRTQATVRFDSCKQDLRLLYFVLGRQDLGACRT
jgi:glycosyltransferase involved in cell wall biosynthesis